MQCSRCQFENMPGQSRCFKCGSVLESKVAVKVCPPRMAKWKKPYRSVTRWLRTHSLIYQEAITIRKPDWLKVVSKDELVGMFLSVVPGLAQIVRKRFKAIRWYCLLWLLLLLVGICFYGGVFCFVLIGLAIGLHTWIAVHRIIKEFSHVVSKVVLAFVLFLALALLYTTIPGWVLPDITSGFTTLNIPYHKVQSRDFMLARRSRAAKEYISRGSLVLVNPPSMGGGNNLFTAMYENTMIVQVIGLPGDKVEINKGFFVINDRQMDAEIYPVPTWLKTRSLSTNIDKGKYFITTEYNVHVQQLSDQSIINVCVIQQENILAKAFMRWLPIWRRGFIREIQ
ncbi:MAG: S26 family signal peptidase [Planctomycetota bacterium]